jgi:hypothetical protein
MSLPFIKNSNSFMILALWSEERATKSFILFNAPYSYLWNLNIRLALCCSCVGYNRSIVKYLTILVAV